MKAKIIQRETNNYPKGMSSTYIMDHYKFGPSDLICHFVGNEIRVLKNHEIFNNKHIVRTRLTHIAKMINEYCDTSKYHIDVILPICLSDKSEVPNQHVPCLAFSKESYSNNILIPSYDQLMGYNGEYEHICMIDKPLFHKREKMCFVGSLTNIGWNGAGMRHNQRLQILNASIQNPDALFARVVRPNNFEDAEWASVLEELRDVFPNVGSSPEAMACLQSTDKVPLTEQIRYRFQLSIDGHTSTWARLPWQLLSQSVVIKVRNNFASYVEWWHSLLEQNVHYFEVDLPDLFNFYEWIKGEPDKQYEVSNAASIFAEEHLGHANCLDYFFLTLSDLTKKQKLQSQLLSQEQL